MISLTEAKNNGVLSDILYIKAVQNISAIAGDLSKITIHGKSNFAGAYLSAEGEEDVFERLKTTKFSVKKFGKHPVILAHFIFKNPPEHERIFVQIIPENNTSEYVKFEFNDDGEFDIKDLRPLTYNELTHLYLDLSIALEARKAKNTKKPATK